jgi:hypothetical protein
MDAALAEPIKVAAASDSARADPDAPVRSRVQNGTAASLSRPEH